MARITSYQTTEKRYLTLRIVGAICTWIGAVLVIIGVALLIFGLHGLVAGMPGEPPRGIPLGAQAVNVGPLVSGLGFWSAVWSLGFFASGLQFLAMGAFFRLAIHVEENTRASAQCLEKIRSRLEPREENAVQLFQS